MRYVCVRFPDSFITIFVGARFQVFLLDNLFGAMINDPRVVFPRRFSKISIDRRPTPELITLPSNELSLRTKIDYHVRKEVSVSMLSTWCNIELVEIPSIDCRDPTPTTLSSYASVGGCNYVARNLQTARSR